MKLKYKIWLDNGGKAFGEGPYQLLCGVKSHGSLAQAAKDLNMSYSRAHGLMKHLCKQLGFSLIESQAGGAGGGGTRITSQAEDLMFRYESFIRESSAALEELFLRHFPPESGLLAADNFSQSPADQAAHKNFTDSQQFAAPKNFADSQQFAAPKNFADSQQFAVPKNFADSAQAQNPEQEAEEVLPLELPVKLRPLQLTCRDVVALTGGGGKTSIMYTLAEELSAGGAKVLLTTTTKIGLPEHGTVHRLIISSEDGIIEQLRQGIKPKEIVAIGGGVREGKLQGLRPEFVDRLEELHIADFILVEADGAAMKPFKAPARHEPVIPGCSTVVLNVVGLDALTMPVTDDFCHRPAEICALSGLKPGMRLTAEAIAQVMQSPQGGRKNVPRGAHWLPVINKIDSEEDLPKARSIAKALVQSGVQDVVFASTLQHKLKVVLWSKSEQ